VYVPEFGWVKPFAVNDTVQSVQQLVCVFPLTMPVKHEPPMPVPVVLAASATPSGSAPIAPDISKTTSPLGALGGISQDSSTSVGDTAVTVIVPLDVLDPESVFGDVFRYVPVYVALYVPANAETAVLPLLVPLVPLVLVPLVLPSPAPLPPQAARRISNVQNILIDRIVQLLAALTGAVAGDIASSRPTPPGGCIRNKARVFMRRRAATAGAPTNLGRRLDPTSSRRGSQRGRRFATGCGP
jgi:hypothetical protein